MDAYHPSQDWRDHSGTTKTRDTKIQIAISLALGIFAFFTFCLLRPRWSGLYAARKNQKDKSAALPELPSSFFGWIVPLWRITDQQVLASAGLDAYVFLAFFKLAIRFLSVTLFFSLAVIKPVHDMYPDEDKSARKNGTRHDSGSSELYTLPTKRDTALQTLHGYAPWVPEYIETDYLWMYPVFAYLFSILALYMLVAETRRIIEVRQEYLGSQTTITDRTIRLSGVPSNLQSEEKIKSFVEELAIGKVESVTLCRNWKELDELVVHRNTLLRKLEESLTVFLGHRSVERNLESLPISQPAPPGPHVNVDDEEENDAVRSQLLSSQSQAQAAPYARVRPKAKLYYGRFKLRSKNVDAIDYYEEKLRVTDDKIRELRKKDFAPTPLAFVTMDSVAACQMASQAVLDPSPLQLLANPSPAPADVIWPNTYISRRNRMIRAWSITLFIGFLTIVWSIILVPIATALNTDAIRKVFPQLAEVLEDHPTVKSLVNTQLPTLIISLLNVLVPYLYAWLAEWQGMTSQGDVELSVISKNFFFTFFNFFVVFTVLGTASNFLQDIGDSLKDTTRIAYTLAQSLQKLRAFYSNFIILQGIGLFPFRLLEFGAVATYPISLMGAKTPRDYAELIQPPTFSYGFYLPQTILIFLICIVYSVLRGSWQVILPGLLYFVIGSYVYKYQLLYAMDHRQHSTGKAWTMICDRVIAGIMMFQITVGGQLALKKALVRSALLIPLLIGTIWFTYVYAKTYRPLMQFIALRSIRRAEQSDYHMDNDSDDEGQTDSGRYASESHNGQTVDESRESGMRFINPSLIAPLEPVWIADKSVSSTRNVNGHENGNGEGLEGDDMA